MPTSLRSTRRQTWLTVYRIGTPILLAALVALTTVLLVRQNILLNRSFMPITATQADRVEQASAYLERAGFNDPVYLGVLPGTEGEYPTFQATAIGGQPVKLLIRTTPNGAWEIQPDVIFETVTSADGFARVAQSAVSDWELVQSGDRPDIKPSKNGEYGEYESRKYNYDQLKKYNPPASYWQNDPSETSGWPRK